MIKHCVIVLILNYFCVLISFNFQILNIHWFMYPKKSKLFKIFVSTTLQFHNVFPDTIWDSKMFNNGAHFPKSNLSNFGDKESHYPTGRKCWWTLI